MQQDNTTDCGNMTSEMRGGSLHAVSVPSKAAAHTAGSQQNLNLKIAAYH